MNKNVTDETILAGIQAGDKSACAMCIEKYGPSIYQMALRLTQNKADAEDVVQETFLSAFKGVDSFEGRSSLGTWLYRIAYNNIMMRLRRLPPDTISVENTLDQGEEGFVVPQALFDWCCLPEEDFQTEEIRLELDKAISTLSPALRSAFTLRELEGLSTRETAAALDITEDVVKTRLRRARLQLRENLAAYFVDR